MLSSSLKTDFDRDGFVIVRNFLPANELNELQDHLNGYIRDIVPTLPPSDAFYEDRGRPETLKQLQRMDCDQFFDEYKQNHRWTELAEALLGEPVAADPPEWFNKPPGTNHVTPPHQDNYYFCLAPPSVLTIWLALDLVDAENGCLRYVAGSHLAGFRPHAKSKILGFSQGITNYTADDFTRERAILLQPGDAVAHHGMTIHRADANHSATRHRRSFAMVFKGVSASRDQEAYQRYLTSAREQHQELLSPSAWPK
ncbi:MAG TPA: phytanoyl-CoA dioxygenase family protein [Pirellulaceae bacterium]|jgi:phytanoyl-CoA hydroxylase